MPARWLGRLLGSALALTALFMAVHGTGETLFFTQDTYDWGLGAGAVVLQAVGGHL